jgi:hypothetical protein
VGLGAVLLLTLNPLAFEQGNAVSIKKNSPCKAQEKGKIVVSGSFRFKCTLTGGKLRWAVINSKVPKVDLKPSIAPGLNLELKQDTLDAIIVIPNRSYLDSNKINGLTVKWSEVTGSSSRLIGTSSYGKAELSTYESTRIVVTLKNLWKYANGEVIAEAFFTNTGIPGVNITRNFLIPGSFSELKPTPTPTPTHTPTPTPTPAPAPVFEELTERDWQFIVKDINGSNGRLIVVYGRITQFDSGTGLNQFRANVAGTLSELTKFAFSGDNSFLVGNSTMLKKFVVDDKFKAKVKVSGAVTYTSTSNIQFTVPQLQILEIDLIP